MEKDADFKAVEKLFREPENAQEVLGSLTGLISSSGRWQALVAHLSSSLSEALPSKGITVLGYLLAAVIASLSQQQQLGQPRAEIMELLISAAATVLKNRSFGPFLSLPNQSDRKRVEEELGLYSSLLAVLAQAQSVAPQLFLSHSLSGLSLDLVLSTLIGLAFLTRRALLGLSSNALLVNHSQLQSIESTETDILRSLCLQNPMLSLVPWAIIMSQLSNLFHFGPKRDGLPIQGTFEFLAHAFGVRSFGQVNQEGGVLLLAQAHVDSLRHLTLVYPMTRTMNKKNTRIPDPWLLARDILLDYIFTQGIQIVLTERNGGGERYVQKICCAPNNTPCTGHYSHFTALSLQTLSPVSEDSHRALQLQAIALQLGILLEIRGSHVLPVCSSFHHPPWVPGLEAHMALQIDADPSSSNMARMIALVLTQFLSLSDAASTTDERVPGAFDTFTQFWSSTIVSPELFLATLNSLSKETLKKLHEQDLKESLRKKSFLFVMYRSIFTLECTPGSAFALTKTKAKGIPSTVFFLRFSHWAYATHLYIAFLEKEERVRELFLDFLAYSLRPSSTNLQQCRESETMLLKMLDVMLHGELVPELRCFEDLSPNLITPINLKKGRTDLLEITKRDPLRFLNFHPVITKHKAGVETRIYGTQAPAPLCQSSLLKQIIETGTPIGPLSQFSAVQDKSKLLAATVISKNPLLVDVIKAEPSLVSEIRMSVTQSLTKLWLDVMLTIPFELFQTYLKEVILFAYPADQTSYLDLVVFEMTKSGALYTATLMSLLHDLLRIHKKYESEKNPSAALFKFVSSLDTSKGFLVDGLSTDPSLLILTLLRDAALSDPANFQLLADFLLDALAAVRADILDRFLKNLIDELPNPDSPYLPILQYISLKAPVTASGLKVSDAFCQLYLFNGNDTEFSERGLSDHPVARDMIIRFFSNLTKRKSMTNSFVERVLVGTGSVEKSDKLWKMWNIILEHGHHEWFAIHWLPRLLKEATRSLQSFSLVMLQKVFSDIRVFEILFLQPFSEISLFGIEELVRTLSSVDQGMVLEPLLIKLEVWMTRPLATFPELFYKLISLMSTCSWPMHQFILRRVMNFAQDNSQLSAPFLRTLHILCSAEPYNKARSLSVFLTFLERTTANSPESTKVCLESFLTEMYKSNIQTREPGTAAGQIIRQRRGVLNKKLQSFLHMCLDAPEEHGSLFAILMQDSIVFLDTLLCLTAEKNTPVPVIYQLIQFMNEKGTHNSVYAHHPRVWESHLPELVERLNHPLPTIAKGAHDILRSLIQFGHGHMGLTRAILDQVLNWLESQTSMQFSTYLVNSLVSLLDSLLALGQTNYMLVVHFRVQKWLEIDPSQRITVALITLVSIAKKCPCDHSLLEICFADFIADGTSRVDCQLTLMETCLVKGFHIGVLVSKTSDLVNLLQSYPLIPRVLHILGSLMVRLSSLDSLAEKHLIEDGEVIRDEFAWVDRALSMSDMLLQRFSWTSRGYRSFVLETIHQKLSQSWQLPDEHRREIWKWANLKLPNDDSLR